MTTKIGCGEHVENMITGGGTDDQSLYQQVFMLKDMVLSRGESAGEENRRSETSVFRNLLAQGSTICSSQLLPESREQKLKKKIGSQLHMDESICPAYPLYARNGKGRASRKLQVDPG